MLDTCVLLADPHAVLRFAEHDVVLPLVVVEELDRHKARMDEVGANARGAIRLLEELGASRPGRSRRSPGRSPAAARCGSSSTASDRAGCPEVLDPATSDHRILSTCLNLLDEGRRAVLVTRDAALRIKGAQLGVEVEDYRADTVRVDEAYSGVIEIDDRPRRRRPAASPTARSSWTAPGLLLNQYVVLRASESQLRPGPGRRPGARPAAAPRVTKVGTHRRAFGVEAKNVRQAFALDLLMDPAIPAVSIMGTAGTGKTFLALAAALEQVVEQERYRRVSVYRPLVAVGRQEIGFLPGDLDEKLAPWMAAVYDNLYAMFSGADPVSAGRAVDELLDRNVLEMAAVTYLRGRSITDEIVIIDEAQNLELPTLKVILTRMAADSKLVFCGDLTQVDNPYVSPFGGLAALIEKFKGSPLFGHVTLDRTVRGPLAEIAATVL